MNQFMELLGMDRSRLVFVQNEVRSGIPMTSGCANEMKRYDRGRLFESKHRNTETLQFSCDLQLRGKGTFRFLTHLWSSAKCSGCKMARGRGTVVRRELFRVHQHYNNMT